MYPWTARGRQVEAYLPHWDPVPQPYDNVTIDLSHTASAGSDAMQMVRDLGDRLAHIHLADGSGASVRDEHLVPGRGTQPVRELLQGLAHSDFSGDVVVEIGTRKARDATERRADIAQSLHFARTYLAVDGDAEFSPAPEHHRPGSPWA